MTKALAVLWRLLSPTRTETVVYLIISSLLLVLISLSALSDVFIDPSVSRLGAGLISEKFNDFLGMLDQLTATSTLSVAIFWGGFGVLLYIAGLTLYEVYTETRNDIIEGSSGIHHPTGFDRVAWIGQALARIGVRALGLVMIGLLAFIGIGFVLPTSVQLMRDVSYIQQRPIFIVNPFLGILLMGLTIHLFVVGLRIILLRLRVGETIEPSGSQ